MNTENDNTLKLRLFEDNGENLYLVAWRGTVCELLCCYNPAHNGAEEVARDMSGLLDGSLKPSDFEEGEWVDELLAGCETEAERAKARKVAFYGLRGLARVWTDGLWVDWEDLAEWTREVRLWYTTNPQKLPTVELCVEYAEKVRLRKGQSVEAEHDETMELLYRAVKDMVWSLDRVEDNMDTLGRIARRGYSFHWSPGFCAVFQDAEGEGCTLEKAAYLNLNCERISMSGYQGKRECDGSDMLHFIANRIEAANKWELPREYSQDGANELLVLTLPLV